MVLSEVCQLCLNYDFAIEIEEVTNSTIHNYVHLGLILPPPSDPSGLFSLLLFSIAPSLPPFLPPRDAFIAPGLYHLFYLTQ